MRVLVRRIAFYVVTAWAAITVDFFIPRLMPGNPVSAVLARLQGQVTASTISGLEQQYGLNTKEGLWGQYVHYLQNLFHGNLGISTSSYPAEVTTVIRGALPDGWAEAPEERRAVADVLIDTLADLHAIDPDAVGLSGYGRPSGLGERQVRRWSDQWERSKSREVPPVDELARLLRADPPRGSGGAIVHGDFRIDNCMLGRQMPPTVRAVLDWELSTLGEPLADLGLFLFYWREPTDVRPAMTPAPTMQPGFPSRAYLAERYATRTGADLSDLSRWVALAHFKSAVIAQGIAARVQAGAMAGQEFGDIGAEVDRIAAEGVALLTETS